MNSKSKIKMREYKYNKLSSYTRKFVRTQNVLKCFQRRSKVNGRNLPLSHFHGTDESTLHDAMWSYFRAIEHL